MMKQRDKKKTNDEAPLHYLKDWHLALESEEEPFYEWPELFKSDWLNEFTINTGRSDYRFVYYGPAGSLTGFHQDVLKSHSWSANLAGQKLWHFWRPGNHPAQYEGKGYITDEKVLETADLVVVQKTGQTVFVPSGWWHQVMNQRETLSINHNWITHHSIRHSWDYLNEQLDLIKSELADLRPGMADGEWAQITQKILRAQTSLDFDDFFNFLIFIKKRRENGISSRGGHFEFGDIIRDKDVATCSALLAVIEPILSEVTLQIKSFDPTGFAKP